VEITMEHLTRTALARELNIGRSTLHRMEQAGLVPPAVRVSGNRSLFSPDAQAVARNLVEAVR
jgi:DNA-binding transcriptional MerR regulator